MDVQLEKLIRLQQVDAEIAQVKGAIATLPNRLEALEQKLQRMKQGAEQAEKAAVAEEAKRRRLESDLRDQQQKIVKYREQSRSVKTNEQFRALQHEIGFAEAEISRIEDAELASMMQSETLDSRRKEARQELAAQGALIEHEKEVLRVDTTDKREELDAHRKERAGLRAAVEQDLLAQYDLLASSSRKTALARASASRCLGCQMALRPQYWNEVRTGSLIPCESCGRLLYFDPSLEQEPEPSPRH